MRALVTGAAGFLGSHLVDALLAGGHEAAGYDSQTYAASAWDHLRRLSVPVTRADVRDAPVLRRAVRAFLPDVVLHLAAESHVDVSLERPGHCFEVNACGTNVVALVCSEARLPLVYCSTDEVYGDLAGTPQGATGALEGDPLRPSSPYSAGKAAGEMAVRAVVRSYGLRAAVTRGCNAFGARQYPEKLLPIACRLAQRPGARVPLHGGGGQVRQWVAAEEFVACLVLAASDLLGRGGDGLRVWNIAGPRRLTVRDLVRAVALQAGADLAAVAHDAPERPGQDRAYHVCGDAVAVGLGFRAVRRVDDLDELAALLAAYPPDGEVRLAHVGPG